MAKTTTNEKPVPHIPLKFEDAVKAALETKPEPKKKKQATARGRKNDRQRS